MTLRKIIIPCISLVFLISSANGKSDFKDCAALPTAFIEGLSRTACEISQSVIIESYSSPRPTSPYASEFDWRNVAIASGKKSNAVMAVAGIKSGPAATRIQTGLLRPPLPDRIAKRYLIPKASRYGHWVIAYEQVEYGAQGSIPGFAMECATAIRSFKQEIKVVAECFPFGGRVRFSKALGAIG